MTGFAMGAAPWGGPRGERLGVRGAMAALQQAHQHYHQHGPGMPGEEDEAGPGRRHRGGRRGPGPWDFGPGPFRPGFPFGGFGGGRSPFGRGGRKAKRGDVRAAILALLSEEPRNGYQIIQEIAERSEGGWKPSPGAVYPALQQLADEGLVRADETEGRKTFQLTDAGREYVAEHADELRAPWEDMTPNVEEGVHELFDLSRQAAAALFQIAQTGSDAQVGQAKKILAETRRKLYQILADGDTPEE
ncbi:PadR family transcriptional regulator [Sphaerisporangium sp. NPDC005288]|uniref:PadR family transcriptional regulator n=1 Tax=Sphaerisporangium sp. NPDC005288 TaxID=3155114 RepID=UPI0033B65F0B